MLTKKTTILTWNNTKHLMPKKTCVLIVSICSCDFTKIAYFDGTDFRDPFNQNKFINIVSWAELPEPEFFKPIKQINTMWKVHFYVYGTLCHTESFDTKLDANDAAQDWRDGGNHRTASVFKS